ncbi:hypothetical protein J1N35_044459 [Gossypium stocksii]|uniref:Uncharacterized protein n=1 Tax=Gossypium stocksii TaxID=47602 RepID=A0A9D3ZG01_9ROSI|nr:hypothetical protein J1N35_044459 [Gossypium stocksii]
MELVDDEDMETMVALYCGTQSNQNAPIQLFVELASVEPTEDPAPLGEEDGAQEPCMVVSISYVDSQSTIHGIDIDLNTAPETDVVGDDAYHNSDPFDHKVDSDNDLIVNEVSDDIDDECVNKDGNINMSSVENQIHRIVIHNNLRAHMSRIDPDMVHTAELSEYSEILPAHQMALYSDSEEFFVGQRFESKEECVFVIKRYSMNISVDYKVVVSKPTLYIGECRAKQMAIEQLYRDFNASYNELQGWIAAMREYVPRTIIKLQTQPYYGSNDQLQPGKRIFQWMFWTFDLCVHAFPHCKSFVQVDGTLLYGVSVCHGDPSSGISRLTSTEIIRMQTGRDKLLATLTLRMGQQQVNQMEVRHVFVEDVKVAMVANRQMSRSINVEVYSQRNKTFRVTKTIGRQLGIPLRSCGVDLQNRRYVYSVLNF